MVIKLKNVQIESLFFQFMKKGKRLSQLRTDVTNTFDSKAHKAYATHISGVATEPEKQDSYAIFENPVGSKNVKPILDRMRKMVFPQDEAKFQSSCKKLARRYREKEKGSTAGVFFVVIFSSEGKRYVALLKLEMTNASWSSFDQKSKKMTLEEILEELPGTGGFRKGAIYPHPLRPEEAYMKVYQKDYASHYFDEFLGGNRRVKAKDVLQELRRLTRPIAGKRASYPQTLDLYKGLASHIGTSNRVVDSQAMTSILKAALPTDVSKVKGIVQKHLKVQGQIRASELDEIKLQFKVGTITVSGRISALLKDFHPFDKRSKNKHRIEGEISNLSLQ